MSPYRKQKILVAVKYLWPFIVGGIGFGVKQVSAQFTTRKAFDVYVNADDRRHLSDSLSLQMQLQGIRSDVQRGNDRLELLLCLVQHKGGCS